MEKVYVVFDDSRCIDKIFKTKEQAQQYVRKEYWDVLMDIYEPEDVEEYIQKGRCGGIFSLQEWKLEE